ncbi:SDR family NAD(P)-dependent oxidoreductase [Candidatus Pelagibacter sp.]|nr:SDR family NAD(P)-dependent oxidoreductase [Candidatus Pelagibacter sp.]
MNKKTIWITGGSTGIGRALAIRFAKEGWNVAVSARRIELLNELTAANKNIYSFPLDVTDEEQCKNVFSSIVNKFQNIDICVFGTGIHDPDSEKVFNLEKIRKIMEVNFFGVMNCVNCIYNYFTKKKNGQISIISSVAGYRGLPAAGGYCASKSALTSFTESLHFDMKRKNVNVTLISPGFIKTPMTDKNKFPMPFIRSTNFAANKIYLGLIKKNNFEIHFPKIFTYMMKIIQILPNWLYFKLINFGNIFMKRDK